jgi:hypothetical protein
MSNLSKFVLKDEKVKLSCNRPWRPIGLLDVEAFTFCLDNRLTDGGEVVSLMRRPPWYSFLLEAESTPGPHCGW